MEDKILKTAMKAIENSICQELVGYGKPLTKIIEKVVADQEYLITEKIRDSLIKVISHDSFPESVEAGLKQKLAGILVGKMGGEFEKRVNELKADPTTRARVVLALEKMIDDITKK